MWAQVPSFPPGHVSTPTSRTDRHEHTRVRPHSSEAKKRCSRTPSGFCLSFVQFVTSVCRHLPAPYGVACFFAAFGCKRLRAGLAQRSRVRACAARRLAGAPHSGHSSGAASAVFGLRELVGVRREAFGAGVSGASFCGVVGSRLSLARQLRHPQQLRAVPACTFACAPVTFCAAPLAFAPLGRCAPTQHLCKLVALCRYVP